MSEPSRIDHLTVLFSAMLAVLMTGRLPDNLSAEDSKDVQEVASRVREDPSTVPRRKRLYAGINKRVADELGLKWSTVRNVAHGYTTSSRISAALDREYKRVEQVISSPSDAALWKSPRCLMRERLMSELPREVHLARGYFGLITRVAKSSNYSTSRVSAVTRGKGQSPRLMQALVSEVRRIEQLPPSSRAAKEGDVAPEVVRARAFIDIYSRVARNEGVHKVYVSKVTRGEEHSPRVLSAIVAEVRRIKAATPLEGE